jgi:hypothetical protein
MELRVPKSIWIVRRELDPKGVRRRGESERGGGTVWKKCELVWRTLTLCCLLLALFLFLLIEQPSAVSFIGINEPKGEGISDLVRRKDLTKDKLHGW